MRKTNGILAGIFVLSLVACSDGKGPGSQRAASSNPGDYAGVWLLQTGLTEAPSAFEITAAGEVKAVDPEDAQYEGKVRLVYLAGRMRLAAKTSCEGMREVLKACADAAVEEIEITSTLDRKGADELEITEEADQFQDWKPVDPAVHARRTTREAAAAEIQSWKDGTHPRSPKPVRDLPELAGAWTFSQRDGTVSPDGGAPVTVRFDGAGRATFTAADAEFGHFAANADGVEEFITRESCAIEGGRRPKACQPGDAAVGVFWSARRNAAGVLEFTEIPGQRATESKYPVVMYLKKSG